MKQTTGLRYRMLDERDCGLNHRATPRQERFKDASQEEVENRQRQTFKDSRKR